MDVTTVMGSRSQLKVVVLPAEIFFFFALPNISWGT